MRALVVAVLFVAGCGSPAVMQTTTEKLPHLVVTATGEDLGVYLGEPDCAWNDKADGEVCYGDQSIGNSPAYATKDCTGAAYFHIGGHQQSLIFKGADGHLLRMGKVTAVVVEQSTNTLQGAVSLWTTCQDTSLMPIESRTGERGLLVDTGATAVPHAHVDLSIDVR